MRFFASLGGAGLFALVAAAPLAACGGGDGFTPLPDGSPGTDAGNDAPPIDEKPTITLGVKDKILLVGTVIGPDDAFEGQVLVEGANITCVAAGTECAGRPGAASATVIDTKGIIAPGLIDTHNHILFDIFDNDDWTTAKVNTNHDQWPGEARYGAMIDVKQCLANDSQGKPAWCAQTPYGTANGSLRCEMDKWGELKALVAGTTSVVGLPGTSAACFGSLARSIDVAQNGLNSDKVQTSAIFPPSKASADGVCNNFTSGTTTSYIIHVGEGTDAKALAEFATLGTVSTTPGCLYAPQTAITHGTAFTANEFKTMGDKGMKLIWSPQSNISLYQATTNVPAALDANVTVAIAPDWSMGGSQNMLDELRFAKGWSDTKWNARLTAKDVVRMATVNPAKALALDTRIGSLKEGYVADIAVFSGNRSAPFDAVIAATPREVRLVMIGGVVLYGDDLLEPAAVSTSCEKLDLCGGNKFLCVALPQATDKLDQTYAQIKAALEKALVDADALTTSDGWNFAPLTPLVKCPN
jgi:cytosine/adenosine deaminase-related metal-dependent hydrolase